MASLFQSPGVEDFDVCGSCVVVSGCCMLYGRVGLPNLVLLYCAFPSFLLLYVFSGMSHSLMETFFAVSLAVGGGCLHVVLMFICGIPSGRTDKLFVLG